MTDNELGEYLTVPGAAAIAGVSLMTMWRWVRDGRVPSQRLGVYSVVERTHVLSFVAARGFDEAR